MKKLISAVALILWASSVGLGFRSAGVYAEDLLRATPGYRFSFPADHGMHPGFETEWWYYTGVLYPQGEDIFEESENGVVFRVPRSGFQLTFFRRERPRGTHAWLAHASLSDFERAVFQHESRYSSGVLGSAGAASQRLRVWHRGWFSEQFDQSHVLSFDVEGSELRLLARPKYGPVLQGDEGLSRKGPCADCASHYYSLPHLEVRGELHSSGERSLVHGLAWMDHEFMTNALQEYQTGWDWFSLYHVSGRRIMAFQVRSEQSEKVFRAGTVIEEDGRNQRKLSTTDISMVPQRIWQSAVSNGSYPVSWLLEVDGEEIQLEALLDGQELGGDDASGIAYWEGAVMSTDRKYVGFLEMTGYAGSVPEI